MRAAIYENRSCFPAVSSRVWTTKPKSPWGNPTGSAPSAALNSRSITHLANCPSRNQPTSFSDEPSRKTRERTPEQPGGTIFGV